MTAKIKLNAASGGGSFSLQAPSSSANTRVMTLPDTADGTILTTTNPKSGNILQVVSSHKVDGFTTTSSSFVDITGMSRTITPTAASSKIHITLHLHVGTADASYAAFNVLRGSTILTQGTYGTGNMTNCSFGTYGHATNYTQVLAFTFLDSPSYSVGDTLTYKIQVASKYSSREICINRTSNGSDQTYTLCGTSTITLEEVAA